MDQATDMLEEGWVNKKELSKVRNSMILFFSFYFVYHRNMNDFFIGTHHVPSIYLPPLNFLNSGCLAFDLDLNSM